MSVSVVVRPDSDIQALEGLDKKQVMRREGSVASMLNGTEFDAIVHCAAAYGRQSDSHASLLDANVLFPLELFDHARANSTRTFIYLDTCFTLDYPYLRPYTLSKKQMVQWGQLTPEDGTLRFINLQLQHPFGPGDRDGKFVPWLIKQCLSSGTIDLTAGTQAKDFVYVSDVADAIHDLLLAESTLAPGFHEFECGRGEAVPVREFVEAVHRLTDSNARLNFGALPTRENEIMFSCANTSPLCDLGWRPKVSIEQGLTETIDSIREHV